jgi:hypothetical protein
VFLANDERAEEAVKLIGEVLGSHVFSVQPDRASATNQGMMIWLRQAVGNPEKPKEICVGNVSKGPGTAAWDMDAVDAAGSFCKTLSVNIDSRTGHVATFDQVVHEFGHALGLGDHFDGFGKPDRAPAVDYNFWAALVRLYQLPLGALYSELRPLA